MKKIIQSLQLICFCLLVACQTTSIDFGTATTYLPAKTSLSKGIVNKYYIHYKKNDSYNTSTDIEYRSYQVGTAANELIHNYYNPAFEQKVAKTFSFQRDQMILNSEKRIWRQDTTIATIERSIDRNWTLPEGGSKRTITFPSGQQTWDNELKQIRDSIIEGKPAKIFEFQSSIQRVIDGKTTTNPMSVKEIYVKDLGLYNIEIIDSVSRTFMELVEQIPISKFTEMAQHSRKRVAYIDPKNTLDKGTDFKPCGINNWIYDYYNGQKDYFYQGGKKEIWKVVNANLDNQKLFKESGYLTIRFVVNCEGTAGYFTTEQANLDFQKKVFNPETVTHFFEITQQLNAFNPTEIQGKKVDAYFYLTYKLKNGELIEILP